MTTANTVQTSAQTTKQAPIAALRRRAHTGLLCATDQAQAPKYNFWQGYLSALRSLQDGSAIKMAAKDAASTYQPPAGFEAAFASLPKYVERLSMVEVAQHLRAQGIKVATHPVPTGQLDAVHQFKDGICPLVDMHSKHAVAGIDTQDGSNCHGASSEKAIVGQRGDIVLQPVPQGLRQTYRDGPGNYRAVDVAGPGYTLHIQTPVHSRGTHDWERPGIWYGNETRTDQEGTAWRRTLPNNFVMDDFGMLVEVSQ